MDILQNDFKGLGRFDVILLMAVVEHLNGSPEGLLGKIRNIIKPNGFIYLDVPNIAEFTKRIMLLTGRSPLPAYRAFYESDYPFMGHNREMTIAEVSYMLDRSGFAVEMLKCDDYYYNKNPTIKAKMLQCMKAVAPLSNKGGLIIAKARIT